MEEKKNKKTKLNDSFYKTGAIKLGNVSQNSSVNTLWPHEKKQATVAK